MPQCIRSLRSLNLLAQSLPKESSYCQSCALRRSAQLRDSRTRSWLLCPVQTSIRPRRTSTLATVTSVHAPKIIRSELQPLYEALKDVKVRAASYVNLSRLQLAVRGLEVEDPVVRVAVLGMNGKSDVRHLVKVLLADPLAAEGTWEKQLHGSRQEDGRGLLIRYGATSSVVAQSPLFQTLSIPSSFLQSHNLELLITSINVNARASARGGLNDQVKDTWLVPSLEAPGSGSGRVSAHAYPVHRTLIYGQGIKDSVAFAQFAGGAVIDEPDTGLLKVALELPAPEEAPTQTTKNTFSAVNVGLASAAIDEFRASLDNAIRYEHGWFRSGMPALMAWLEEGTVVSNAGMKPAVRNLISSILNETVDQINAEDVRKSQDSFGSSLTDNKKQSLNNILKSWAEHAHGELQQQLDIAFHGRKWRKLRWWRLFWRVDDVGMIATEVIERRWLVEAEKEIIWISGGISQATNKPIFVGSNVTEEVTSEPTIGSSPPEVIMVRRIPKDDDVELPEGRPWPPDIAIARTGLVGTAVPPLEALAMTLVLETLSTITLTSALSGLLYFSISTTSIYEAGAIAALGLVWSMRRLQRKWEEGKTIWMGEVREEGRLAVKETETKTGLVIEHLGRPKIDVDSADDRSAAREAVERAQKALANLV